MLRGFCYGPKISFPSSKVFFPPSYVGVSTKQKFAVKNDARIPLEFEWRVPDKYKNEVKFEPGKAVLMPNEEANLYAFFTPLKVKEYQINIPIFARNLFEPIKQQIGFFAPGSGLMLPNPTLSNEISSMKSMNQSVGGQQKQLLNTLTIIGAGSDGKIQISPSTIDFGTITVGFSKTLSVTITNKSNCNVYIELKMMQSREADKTQRSSQVQEILNECFKFDNHKGIVNAKSKKKVNITFKPNCRFEFDTILVCIAREKLTKDLSASLRQQDATLGGSLGKGFVEKDEIMIRCKGDYPLLRLTDVRNDQVSIANLWERFMLTKMNKELLLPLNESEVAYNNSDDTDKSGNLDENLSKFSWDFGKLPIKNGSKPRKITLTLKNIGGVQADWCFKMPNDSEIQTEAWADPGEPSEEQAFEKDILEKKIFKIEPKRGSLAPGEQMDLSVMYYPKEVKKHYLNTIL